MIRALFIRLKRFLCRLDNHGGNVKIVEEYSRREILRNFTIVAGRTVSSPLFHESTVHGKFKCHMCGEVGISTNLKSRRWVETPHQ